MLSESTRIGCPLVTPFDGDDGAQAVDHDALAALVGHVVDGGVDALVPCGTTGEFASLTPAEQRRVIETTVEAAGGVPVVGGASATSVGEARDRIAAAADAGADAAMVLPPYYLTASDPAGDERFFSAVVEDSPLPVYLYDIPSVVGSSLAPETTSALAEREHVVGIKDSSGDLAHVSEVLTSTPEDFQVFQGYDALLVPAAYAGATGGINALSHLLPREMSAAVDAVRSGDHDRARAIQREHVDPLFRFCREYGFAPAIKVALAEVGVLPSAAVRPPLVPPDGDARDEISGAVERLRAEAG